MGNLALDLKFAIRTLADRPMHAFISVLVLALAIGANTTIFTVYNGLFLRPLPYPDDDRLVIVYNTYPKSGLEYAGTSIPDYIDRREQAPSLEDLAIYTGTMRTLGGETAPERIFVPRVSPSLFSTLGVGPQFGRTFTDEEATPGNDTVVVLSHGLWTTRFGARADIIGQSVLFDDERFTVVGVMPEHFVFPSGAKAWVPFAFTPGQMSDQERGTEFSASIGRLRPGATLEGLNQELDTIVQRNVNRVVSEGTIPNARELVESSGFTGRARYYREMAVGNLERMMVLLQGTVLVVLLIACANVASLQLARIVARRKELSTRAVLGARRGQLAMLVLTESSLLAALGAAAGIVLTFAGLELVHWLGLDRSHQGFEFALDWRVLAFTAGAALLAALGATVLPVFALSRENIAQSINEAGRLGGGGHTAQGMRSTLVVAQIALSVALLVGAGLLTKSFYRLQQVGPGFDVENILTGRISLPEDRYPDDESRVRYYERALEELRALPGVEAAGQTTVLPFTGSNSQGSSVIDGYTPPEGAPNPHTQVRSIDENYLPMLGIPVVQGRNFEARESERVAIVDENMARRYWPGGDALGQRVRRTNDPEDRWYTVIGVVPAVKHGSLAEDPTKETIYWHYRQRPREFGVFTLKTAVPPEQLTRVATDAVLRVDPELPLFDVRALDTRVMQSLGPQRTPLVLTLVFAAIAFTLAIIGIYGLLTSAVTQRVAEIGVRMALGARAADITRLVVAQGGRLVVIGIVTGTLVALALGRVMTSQLHEVSAFDPAVFAVIITGITVATLLASWLPARRAANIDPMEALRDE